MIIGQWQEERWLTKVSSIMRFDKELKDWFGSVPGFLRSGIAGGCF